MTASPISQTFQAHHNAGQLPRSNKKSWIGNEVKVPDTQHLSLPEPEAGLEHIRQSPKDEGALRMVVRRPREDERETVQTAKPDLQQGLIGDNWKIRGNKNAPDGSANIKAQVTFMNSRTIGLPAQNEERWPLAGDQLYIDMDLSGKNLPPGMRREIGTAALEVTAVPHTGCNKFAMRYGTDATRFVNSPEGKRLHLRGIHANVVRVGDAVRKIS